MSSNKPLVFLSILVIAAVQGIYYYTVLPVTMAVHFNYAGMADRWGNKDDFFIVYSVTVAIFACMVILMAHFTRRLPDRLINLPNKEYWLAPERRDRTFDYLAGWMYLYGAGTLLYIITFFFIGFRSNLAIKPALQPVVVWGMIAAYTLLVIIGIVRMVLHFSRVDGRDNL